MVRILKVAEMPTEMLERAKRVLLVDEKTGAKNLRMIRVDVKPKAPPHVSYHLHTKQESVYYVIQGKAKMIILAANCPKDIKEEIEYNCNLSNVPVMMFKGASIDLATVCNKPFVISALSIEKPVTQIFLRSLKTLKFKGNLEEVNDKRHKNHV